jgi:hypothetical protein
MPRAGPCRQLDDLHQAGKALGAGGATNRRTLAHKDHDESIGTGQGDGQFRVLRSDDHHESLRGNGVNWQGNRFRRPGSQCQAQCHKHCY